MKKIATLIAVIGLFMTTSSFHSPEAEKSEKVKRSCSNTLYGRVISKLDCVYQFDGGSGIVLVPIGGYSLTVGACYRIEYTCGFGCGSGAVTSAKLLSACP